MSPSANYRVPLKEAFPEPWEDPKKEPPILDSNTPMVETLEGLGIFWILPGLWDRLDIR